MSVSTRMDDVIVVGAGAAGIATAIFVARSAPHLQVRCLDGARRVGAKILVSGGSRCNVTNREVTERDFWGGSFRVVRNVLRAFPAERAAAFFEELGVLLHEEEDGKLFPDTNRSRTVLDALLNEATGLSIVIDTDHRVTAVRKEDESFVVSFTRRADPSGSADSELRSKAVVIATGGRSLPRPEATVPATISCVVSVTVTWKRRPLSPPSCWMATATPGSPASRIAPCSACA